jgi:hypothetical protein
MHMMFKGDYTVSTVYKTIKCRIHGHQFSLAIRQNYFHEFHPGVAPHNTRVAREQ